LDFSVKKFDFMSLAKSQNQCPYESPVQFKPRATLQITDAAAIFKYLPVPDYIL
jgi:hypothetical protein